MAPGEADVDILNSPTRWWWPLAQPSLVTSTVAPCQEHLLQSVLALSMHHCLPYEVKKLLRPLHGGLLHCSNSGLGLSVAQSNTKLAERLQDEAQRESKRSNSNQILDAALEHAIQEAHSLLHAGDGQHASAAQGRAGRCG